MRRHFESLFLISFLKSSLGGYVSNLEDSLVFNCYIGNSDVSTPWFIDNEISESSDSIHVRQIYQLLVKQSESPSEGIEGVVISAPVFDGCRVTADDKSLWVPAAIYQIGSLSLAVTAIGVGSQFFTNIDWLAFATTSSLSFLSVGLTGNEYEAGCSLSNRMTLNDGLRLESAGILIDSGYSSLAIDRPVRFSSVSPGLTFSPDLVQVVFDLVSTQSGWVDSLFDGENIIVLCEQSNLPEFVLTFSGQNGYGVRVPLSMKVLPSGKCVLDVFVGTEVVFGTPFFKSGVVRMHLDNSLVLCPLLQYHSTDPAFDFTKGSPPQPRGLAETDIPTVTPKEGQSGIWIGVTIGGFVAIVLTIAFFVWKSRQKPKQIFVYSPTSVTSDQASTAGLVGNMAPRASHIIV